MEAYPSKLRELALDASEQGLPTKQIAERFKVSRSWVRRVKQRLREHGLRAAVAQAQNGPAPALDAADRQRLAAAVARAPDATLAELRRDLALPVSVSTVARALAGLRLTFKKSPSAPPSRTART
jgi:transposase